MQPQITVDSFFQAISQNFPLISLVVVLAVGSALWCVFSPRIKGYAGEAIVNLGALGKLDALRYHTFNDIYLPRPDGEGTTQIDHVVVSAYGIFVIETKNYTGWIFGSSGQAEWRQILKGGMKIPFQNPLKQNWLHISALAKELDLPVSVLHPIIYFAGESTFKTHMPDNVMNSGLKTYIEGHRHLLLSDEEAQRATAHLAGINAPVARKKAKRNHAAWIKRKTAARV